ncbi:MAG: TonB-dependent receptor, partial [Cyclobacteriaceae bacterium]
MQNFTKYLYLPFLLLIASHLGFGQGATTAKMNGRILDENGEGLPGANVIAVHQPTGSQFGSVSNIEGLYNIVNMTVGGPYTVTVSFVGYEDQTTENVYLELAQTFKLDVGMKEAAEQLEAIEIVATGGVFDGNRTGATTKVGKETLTSAPTVSRDLSDFTRLDPRASINLDGEGNSISFGGINNRYNAIFIDGAVNNDLFGLAQSGTNGGQTGISPISIDALQEVQIVLAPYDVTLGGFAGGGINAVTRSGTNQFEGSVYYLFRNEGIAGKTPETPANGSREKLPDFSSKTYGARLGGPIIKNKLFFFVNAEIQRDETPEPFDFGNYNGTATQADLDAIIAKVRNDYNYEPGDFLNTSNKLEGEKFLGKINWNITNDHKVSFRHSYTKATVLGRRTVDASNLTFENNGQNFPSTTNSSALEWKANFSDQVSNNLIVGYTTVRDDRDILGEPFPNISISDGNAEINLGAEPFSFANVVEQDVLTITDNLTVFKGKHTFTFGTHNEFYKIFNLFLPLHVPQYSYSSVDKFFADEAFLYLYGHEIGNQNIGDDAVSVAADFNAFQLAFYGQDEIQVNDRLKLTLGIRLDIPSFIDDAPQINTDFNNNVIPILEEEGYDLEGARAGIPPSTQFMLSPRVGFNYDLRGDKTTQVRGGIGVFTSRIPF